MRKCLIFTSKKLKTRYKKSLMQSRTPAGCVGLAVLDSEIMACLQKSFRRVMRFWNLMRFWNSKYRLSLSGKRVRHFIGERRASSAGWRQRVNAQLRAREEDKRNHSVVRRLLNETGNNIIFTPHRYVRN